MRPALSKYLFLSALLCLLPFAASSCNLAGAIMHAIPPPNVLAAYRGLENQPVGVMVWADRPIRIDWENMQIDLSTVIQSKLKKLQKNEKQKELEGTTFPYQPASVAKWQRDHPEAEGQPVIDFAPRLGGITRLIYVEVHEFQTRSDSSLELYKGQIVGSMKVIEIKDGTAKVAFEENDIRCTFPPKIPTEGVLGLNDYAVYLGTLDALATQVVYRLVEHEAEEP